MGAPAPFFITAAPPLYLAPLAQASHKKDSVGVTAGGLPRHRQDGTASRWRHHGL